jgi:hypothetical protein
MQTLSPAIRLALGALAAGLATVMAPDVFGILPLWLQIVFGFVSAALAFMLLPINWIPTDDGNRAISVARRGAALTPRRGTQKRRGGTGIAVLVVLMLAVAAGAFVPSPESGDTALLVRSGALAMVHQLKPYAVAWLTQQRLLADLDLCEFPGRDYSHPAFNSFVRDKARPGPFSASGSRRPTPTRTPSRAQAHSTTVASPQPPPSAARSTRCPIGQASINLAGVDWFYLYWRTRTVRSAGRTSRAASACPAKRRASADHP